MKVAGQHKVGTGAVQCIAQRLREAA